MRTFQMIPSSLSGLLLGATFLLGSMSSPAIAVSTATASPVSDAQSLAPPSAEQPLDPLAMSVETSHEPHHLAKKPPTHQQRCLASCRGIVSATAHSKCMHKCMSR